MIFLSQKAHNIQFIVVDQNHGILLYYCPQCLRLIPRINFITLLITKIIIMILSTTETIPNREINQVKGIARGSTVRTRNVGRDILAGLKNLVGGEIEEYTKLQADAREQALQRMITDGSKLGADAIVNVRFTTSVITQAASEVLAYGTAVILK